MIKNIGFPINHKENENRRALLLDDIKFIRNKKNLYFEKGYGLKLGVEDEEFIRAGANIAEREEILKKDIICDAKAGDSDYIETLTEGQIVFGWIHAVQSRDITDKFINNKLTGIAWEDMFEEGRHVFWRNNELAGESAVYHAFLLYGKLPRDTKVAILGRGNVALGACKMLTALGAHVTIYNRNTEKLFVKEIGKYDVLVNAIIWDTNRKDHIIYKEDLKRMKRDSMIIDVSCDANRGIETSKLTSIEHPTYFVNGVLHYVVDHTPSIFYKSASKSISSEVCKYLDDIMEDKQKEIKVLKDAIIIENGEIIDNKINMFQKR
ncbi:MAG: N(5)-(carboxyethyl)ornithine synthase [Clostridium sp.]|nr:N(5)-(carboxyethyl)ornithine synthase [Clostridium sp.]